MAQRGEKSRTFNKDELEWLSRNCCKRNRQINRTPFMFKQKDREMYDYLQKKIGYLWDLDKGDLAKEPPKSGKKINLSKEGLDELKSIVDKGIELLQTKIIPGYKKRMKGPTDRPKYKPYLDQASEIVETLKSLSKKLEGDT